LLIAQVVRAEEANRALEMVFIPAGEFEMGSSEEEVQALAEEYGVHPSLFAIETPRRKVYVKSFLIDRYPVTNAEYAQFLEATKRSAPWTWPGGKYPAGEDDYPVTGVSWEEAAAYAAWAGKRLPTAEEWEKAARGTDGRVYPWGNDWREDACWTDAADCPQALARTTPVGAFPAGASPYGVMDMCGNVAEWTATEASGPDPKSNLRCYVVKGAGGAHRQRYNFRCAALAFSAHQTRRHTWLGFRCAMDADEAPRNLAPPRPVPPLPQPPRAAGPDMAAYGAERIKIVAVGEHWAQLRVPYFPTGLFGLNLPEHIGAAGLPFGWNMPHEPYQWELNEERTVGRYRCVWSNTAEMAVELIAGIDEVSLNITLKNLTDKPMTGVMSNVCFNPDGSPYFNDPERIRTMVWTDEGPVSVNRLPAGGRGEPMHTGWAVAKANEPARAAEGRVRYPLIFLVSRDGQFTIAQAYARGEAVASNAHYSCLHTRPVWENIPAGGEQAVRGKLYFVRGGPEELLERWRRDFGQD
jgi:formylglycine-generating enzyme required for sulfatase activity